MAFCRSVELNLFSTHDAMAGTAHANRSLRRLSREKAIKGGAFVYPSHVSDVLYILYDLDILFWDTIYEVVRSSYFLMSTLLQSDGDAKLIAPVHPPRSARGDYVAVFLRL